MSETETKFEKLIRLTNQRVPKILKALDGVARLASYDPTPDQAKKIVKALREQVDAVENALLGTRKSPVQDKIL